MIDERALIRRLEASGPEELAEMVTKPSEEEERAFRIYLGNYRYDRLHTLAIRRGMQRGPNSSRGNVVVIPGIMASELTAVSRSGEQDQLWITPLRIILGRLPELRLAEDGRHEFNPGHDVRASGILKRYYGDLLLSLAEQWTVRAFWFDWRKDMSTAADELRAQISAWFGEDEPVHLVAHSMGGLVARTFIVNHPDRWKSMSDPKGNRGGRLVMLGTPNYGSFAIVQALTGLEGAIKKLAKVDLFHSSKDILKITNSFVGSYQMLPVAEDPRWKHLKPLYRAGTYGEMPVSQKHLDSALTFQERLLENRAATMDPARMIYIAGANQPTLDDIADPRKVADSKSYRAVWEGDGRVTWERGGRDNGNPQIPWYFVEESHADLPSNDQVLGAITDLLESGETSRLAKEPPERKIDERTRALGLPEKDALSAFNEKADADIKAVGEVADRLRNRLLGRRFVGIVQDDGPSSRITPPLDEQVKDPGAEYVSSNERELADLLLRDVIGSGEKGRPVETVLSFGTPPTIRIRIVAGEIEAEEVYKGRAREDLIDAIAVGHYLGLRPQASELSLDRAISAHLPGRQIRSASDLLLTQLTDRGTLVGELGRHLFVPDPRSGGRAARVIAVAGMGQPGSFGAPELSVLVRELCWTLGQMGKANLATVLIGSGNGNLPVREATAAWVRGIELALRGGSNGSASTIKEITFVNRNRNKIVEMHDAIIDETERLGGWGRLRIEYERDGGLAFAPGGETQVAQEARLKALREARRTSRESLVADANEWSNSVQTVTRARNLAQVSSDARVPTRLTLEMKEGVYHFSAITSEASVPERTTPLDPTIALQANDELAAEENPVMQLERGKFLECLLLPSDLRPHLVSDAPISMLLDATTARIHWEMVAQPDPAEVYRIALAGGDETPFDPTQQSFDRYRFLGTARGFTRQLRTAFAPPPEPPPPPRRKLRVLIVADPAADARLPGAEEEGVAVADLCTFYNQLARSKETEHENVIEFKALFGPTAATRTNVLRELSIRPYDVLHYAGHCFYDAENPAASGWVFKASPRQSLSARELYRIDRVPKFVFSNACESGITPDRSELRTAALAPSFAEAFFGRGVGNFVCTAWPVDDLAARKFATRLYAGLLGIEFDSETGLPKPTLTNPEPMYLAMQNARIAIAETSNGARTWGAYQHYGNPFFRLLAPVGRAGSEAESRTEPQEDRVVPRVRRAKTEAAVAVKEEVSNADN